MRQTIDTTYADLRPTDLVIDKSGQAWPIAELVIGPVTDVVNFWLCDPVTNVRMYLITTHTPDPVKVSRLPSLADEARVLADQFPDVTLPQEIVDSFNEVVAAAVFANSEPINNVTPEQLEPVTGSSATMAEAVAAVEEIGGTVEAEVIAEEVDAAAAATDDAPVSLPPFADMTPLEQRSHLYLLHGLYGSDVTGKAELIAIHDQAHAQHDAGTLNSRHVPHVHEVK